MSGVASKVAGRLQRSRSLSLTNLSSAPLLSGQAASATSGSSQSSAGLLSVQNDTNYNSLRRLHGSILNPRAPKIRHLNASHTLLMDLDKHIARVQELEEKVYGLELQLQMREAKKSVESVPSIITSDISNNRLKQCRLTEPERIAFQNRLREARKRSAELSKHQTAEEANILRGWHSKRLKTVVDGLLATADQSPRLLLPLPSQVEEDENQIFMSLNAIVDIANEQQNYPIMSSDSYLDQLQALMMERDRVAGQLEAARAKACHSDQMVLECQASLENLLHSATALNLELQSTSNYYRHYTQHSNLGSRQLQQQENSHSCPTSRRSSASDVWIYGPNPIFSPHQRAEEIQTSFELHFIQQMLHKMDISRVHAENNVAFAQRLATKYRQRLADGAVRMEEIEAGIDRLIELVNTENNTREMKANVKKLNVAICDGEDELSVEEEHLIEKKPLRCPTRMMEE